MHSELVANICRVGIFVICAQVIVHFRPSRSYEKYLKMLVSAMILVQLIRPLDSVLNGESAQNLEARIRWFEERLAENRKKAEQSAAQGEAMRERMTLEEVRRRMEEEKQESDPTQEADAQNEEESDGYGAEERIYIEEIPPVEEIRIE